MTRAFNELSRERKAEVESAHQVLLRRVVVVDRDLRRVQPRAGRTPENTTPTGFEAFAEELAQAWQAA